jgi:hypothetical protein
MKYSFHVQQRFGDDFVNMWPYAAVGDYCDDFKQVKRQYKNMLEENPTNTYRVVRYRAVTRGCVCKTIVGIEGAPTVMLSNE